MISKKSEWYHFSNSTSFIYSSHSIINFLLLFFFLWRWERNLNDTTLATQQVLFTLPTQLSTFYFFSSFFGDEKHNKTHPKNSLLSWLLLCHIFLVFKPPQWANLNARINRRWNWVLIESSIRDSQGDSSLQQVLKPLQFVENVST